MAEGLDIGNLALLQLLMTSNAGGTNLNTLQDIFSQGSLGLPLSVALGTQPFEELQYAVEDAMWRPLAADQLGDIDFEMTRQAYAGDPVAQSAFAYVDAGGDVDQWAASQKATNAMNTELSDSAKKAQEFIIDGVKSVAKVYQQQVSAAEDLSRREALGEIAFRDGQWFEATTPEARSARLSDLGITGVLANPEMYKSESDYLREAAQRFSNEASGTENQRKGEIWDQQVKDIGLTAEQTRAIRKFQDGQVRRRLGSDPQTQQQDDRSWWRKAVDFFGAPENIGAQSPNSDPDQMLGSGGSTPIVGSNGRLSNEEIAARAGMYYSDKNEQAAAKKRDESNVGLEALKRQNAERLSGMLDQADRGDKTTRAENYLANQQALISALATPQQSTTGGSGYARRPQVRLRSDEIDGIISSIVR